MHVGVHDQDRAERFLGVQVRQGHRHVGVDAEAAALIAAGVMEAATQVDRQSLFARQAAGPPERPSTTAQPDASSSAASPPPRP